MRQGRTQCLAFAALTAMVLAMLPSSGHAVVRESATMSRVAKAAPAEKRADTQSRAKRAAALRQFSGYVSAIDGTSITVEKRGKVPESRVFTKHDDMRTTGDVEKDARVTVYYREEGGKAIAHRVVVKPARSGSNSRG